MTPRSHKTHETDQPHQQLASSNSSQPLFSELQAPASSMLPLSPSQSAAVIKVMSREVMLEVDKWARRLVTWLTSISRASLADRPPKATILTLKATRFDKAPALLLDWVISQNRPPHRIKNLRLKKSKVKTNKEKSYQNLFCFHRNLPVLERKLMQALLPQAKLPSMWTWHHQHRVSKERQTRKSTTPFQFTEILRPQIRQQIFRTHRKADNLVIRISFAKILIKSRPLTQRQMVKVETLHRIFLRNLRINKSVLPIEMTPRVDALR